VKRPRDPREILDPIADFVVEDILSVSDDQLLAEAAEEYGSSGALAAEFDAITLPAMSSRNTSAIKQSLSVAANGTPQQDYRASLDDLIVEDILSMSDDQLLAEAAEEYGSSGALAAEFDAITLPAMSSYNNGAIKQDVAPAGAPAPSIILGKLHLRAFVGPSPAIRWSFLQSAIAMMSEWLAAPLRRRAALSAFATLLTVAVLTPGIYLLVIERSIHRGPNAAEPLYKRPTAIDEKAFGPDYPGLTRAWEPAAQPDASVAPVPSNRPPAAATSAPMKAEAGACARDTERLARLRADPTIGALAQFERELACEQIRPQLRRLRESVGQ
jgi:hypothetical protein